MSLASTFGICRCAPIGSEPGSSDIFITFLAAFESGVNGSSLRRVVPPFGNDRQSWAPLPLVGSSGFSDVVQRRENDSESKNVVALLRFLSDAAAMWSARQRRPKGAGFEARIPQGASRRETPRHALPLPRVSLVFVGEDQYREKFPPSAVRYGCSKCIISPTIPKESRPKSSREILKSTP